MPGRNEFTDGELPHLHVMFASLREFLCWVTLGAGTTLVNVRLERVIFPLRNSASSLTKVTSVRNINLNYAVF
jgi:hypothetical protein